MTGGDSSRISSCSSSSSPSLSSSSSSSSSSCSSLSMPPPHLPDVSRSPSSPHSSVDGKKREQRHGTRNASSFSSTCSSFSRDRDGDGSKPITEGESDASIKDRDERKLGGHPFVLKVREASPSPRDHLHDDRHIPHGGRGGERHSSSSSSLSRSRSLLSPFPSLFRGRSRSCSSVSLYDRSKLYASPSSRKKRRRQLSKSLPSRRSVSRSLVSRTSVFSERSFPDGVSTSPLSAPPSPLTQADEEERDESEKEKETCAHSRGEGKTPAAKGFAKEVEITTKLRKTTEKRRSRDSRMSNTSVECRDDTSLKSSSKRKRDSGELRTKTSREEKSTDFSKAETYLARKRKFLFLRSSSSGPVESCFSLCLASTDGEKRLSPRASAGSSSHHHRMTEEAHGTEGGTTTEAKETGILTATKSLSSRSSAVVSVAASEHGGRDEEEEEERFLQSIEKDIHSFIMPRPAILGEIARASRRVSLGMTAKNLLMKTFSHKSEGDRTEGHHHHHHHRRREEEQEALWGDLVDEGVVCVPGPMRCFCTYSHGFLSVSTSPSNNGSSRT